MSLESIHKKPKRVGLALSKSGALVSLGAIAFAFSPIGLAFLGTGGNPFGEGVVGGGPVTGWGGIMYAMIFTLPLGAITAGIGIVLMLTGVIHTLRTKTPTAEENAETRSMVLKEKSISFALLVPATMITQPVLAFVLGNMTFGPAAAPVTIFVTSGLAIGAIGTSLAFAIQSKSQKFQITVIVLAVLFLAGLFFEATSLYMLFEDFNN